jgi:hypothetical protein
MAFMRDHLGNLIPPGRTHKILRWECWNDVALPSWLTSDQGTVTFPAPVSGASGIGKVRVTTGAVSGNQANIKLAFSIDPSVFAAMIFTVEGLQYDTNTTMDTELSMFGTAGIGVGLRQLTAETQAKLMYNQAVLTPDTLYANALNANTGTTGRRNLSIAGSALSRQVGAYQDDQEIAWRQSGSTWTAGVVTPKLELTTRSAVAHWFDVGAVQLDLYY